MFKMYMTFNIMYIKSVVMSLSSYLKEEGSDAIGEKKASTADVFVGMATPPGKSGFIVLISVCVCVSVYVCDYITISFLV